MMAGLSATPVSWLTSPMVPCSITWLMVPLENPTTNTPNDTKAATGRERKLDAASPMAGITAQDLVDTDAEFVVRLTAYDDTTGQTVHVRTSYRAVEVEWGARFVNIIDRESADGIIRVDVTRLDEIEPAALPSGSP